MSSELNKKREFVSTAVKVGDENILYVTIPYKGCTVKPKCLFCGVREKADRNLAIDEKFGIRVRDTVSELLTRYSPDVLVLYNGGNILRPAEMFQQTIIDDIPRHIAEHSNCNAYELEIRVDDVLKFRESLAHIKSILGDKKLRVRLGIEYYDDALLKRHKKGVQTKQIDEAVKELNGKNIEWNGYAMLGGLDMDKDEAIKSAIETGKFMLKNNAYKISINGMFVTQKLYKSFGNRIYVPSYLDLVTVLKELCKYRDEIGSSTLFKVGYEEEDMDETVRIPYAFESQSPKEIAKKFEDFNKSQNSA